MKNNSWYLLLLFVMAACSDGNTVDTKDPVVIKITETDSVIPQETSAVQYAFNLNEPDKTWELPKGLEEVSGNTWANGQLILIEDERPVLYIIETIGDEMKVQKKISFAKVAGENIDIEEVTIAGEVIYAISGDGRLFEINDWKGSPQFRELKTGLSKSNNTEGLCFDPETKKLLIACKDDSGLEDEKKSTKVIYSYNPETEKTEGPFLKIEQDDLESFSGEKIKLNPSSIAVHPITKEIYVLSSKGSKCLVVLSREGAVRSVNFINDDLMHQPEGICFSDKGDMYLSSEGKKGNPGKLFLYSIKQ